MQKSNTGQNKRRLKRMNQKRLGFLAFLLATLFLLNLGFRAIDADRNQMTYTENPNQNMLRFKSKCKQLIRAINDGQIAQVESLLASVDPNCIDDQAGYETISLDSRRTIRVNNPQTALVAAARKGDLAIVKRLIDKQADVELHGPDNLTPLMEATAKGKVEIINYLLSKGADVDKKIEGYGTALFTAVLFGQVESLKLLHTHGADVDQYIPGVGNPMLIAARDKQMEVMKYLYDQGVDINTITEEGSPILIAAQDGNLEMVKFLTNQGANIDDEVPGHGNALSVAARDGFLEIVKFLIQKGANVNAVVNNKTALLEAVSNGNYQVASVLLESGAKPDLEVENGLSPWVQASRDGDSQMIKLLKKYK